MSGVKIGYVDKIDLQGDGGQVRIGVKLYPKYRDQIRHGAVFRIKSSGFGRISTLAFNRAPRLGIR